jgi:hypothetical protein
MARFGARLLQVATAALYLGPLLAGLSGFGWAMLAPFVSIFTLWLVITRPQQWPQTAAEWLTREAWLAALAQILSQTLLVAVCFGIGRGIGGATGALPMLHPILPVALSFTALAIARLSWDPDRALAEGLSIDELLYPAAHPPLRRPVLNTEAAVGELLDLADDAPMAQAQPLLAEVMEDTDSFARLAALIETLAVLPPPRHLALRRALILWATEPEAFAAGTTPGALRAAFAAAGQDGELLATLLPRAQALASAVPERADQFPDPAVIEDIARRGPSAELSAGLSRLARQLRRSPAPRPARRSGPTGGGLQRA